MLGARYHLFHYLHLLLSVRITVKTEETYDHRDLKCCRSCPLRASRVRAAWGLPFQMVFKCSRNLYFTSCKMRFATNDSAATQGRSTENHYMNRSWYVKEQSWSFALLLNSLYKALDRKDKAMDKFLSPATVKSNEYMVQYQSAALSWATLPVSAGGVLPEAQWTI